MGKSPQSKKTSPPKSDPFYEDIQVRFWFSKRGSPVEFYEALFAWGRLAYMDFAGGDKNITTEDWVTFRAQVLEAATRYWKRKHPEDSSLHSRGRPGILRELDRLWTGLFKKAEVAGHVRWETVLHNPFGVEHLVFLDGRRLTRYRIAQLLHEAWPKARPNVSLEACRKYARLWLLTQTKAMHPRGLTPRDMTFLQRHMPAVANLATFLRLRGDQSKPPSEECIRFVTNTRW